MKRAHWPWLLALLVLLAWYGAGSRPVHRAPGILAPAEPQQQGLGDDVPELPARDEATLKPLARFAATARVLGREDYRWDEMASLVPTDLALGWGRMSDSAVLDRVDISQSGRFYFWQVREFPIPEREIIRSSANMHLVPADASIRREIGRTRVGDVVEFDGYLVEVDWRNGAKSVSSLTRADSGAGACEIVWVEHFSIGSR